MWIGSYNFYGNPATETQSTPKTPLPPSHLGRFGASWASPPGAAPALWHVTPGVVVSAPSALHFFGAMICSVSFSSVLPALSSPSPLELFWANPPWEAPTLAHVTPGVVVLAPVALHFGSATIWS